MIMPSQYGGAHPRSRGEHARRMLFIARALGSSPLTRGAQTWLFVTNVTNGLIPAHAGSTLGLLM